MKTITIRLPDVEAAMLVEVQRRNGRFRDIGALVAGLVRVEFEKRGER